MADIAALVDKLLPSLGSDGVLLGDAVSSRSAGIWRSDTVQAPVIFRPSDTAGVAAVLKACNAVGQRVVTHGGLTGLVEGAVAGPEEVVLSTERMQLIEHVDPVNRTLQLQAGVKLQTACDAAAAAGMLLALDLGARGSCTVGGNAATNAGGNNVLRYGMAREQILGLEAVLADGTVVSSLNGMLKNNAGYDLKQLFIGSEGTLGVITRLVLRLRAACPLQDTALLACRDFTSVEQLLQRLDAGLGGTLSAFELLWNDFYTLAAGDRSPLPHDYPYYVLAEAAGNEPGGSTGSGGDSERFLRVISAALDEGCAADAVVAQSGREREELWQLRESVELTLENGPAQIFDVSLPLTCMEAYVREVAAALTDEWGAAHRLWVFGHAGDGNLHLVVAAGDGDAASRQRIERCVYTPLGPISGSVSAEHGIGLEKRDWLSLSRSPEEVALMRRLKVMMDPNNILNPGRVLAGEGH